jgi:antitoxin VapB
LGVGAAGGAGFGTGIDQRRFTPGLLSGRRWHILWHMPNDPHDAQRRVRLFRNGRNQAVRIPREYELPGDEAIIRREGDRLILEPAAPTSLLAVLATLDDLEEEFPGIEDAPPDAVDL